MTKLLNRFAWLIAIWAGFWIWYFFQIFGFYREEAIIIWIVAIFIIKFFFLSKNFIVEKLDFFAKSIKNNYLEKWVIIEKKSEEKIIENKIEEEKKPVSEFINEELETDLNTEKEENKIINEKIKEEKLYIKSEEIEPTVFDLALEKVWNYIKEFFSTNLLAKLGGILVFLAVVYFLKGIAVSAWEAIWPVWRIIVGFLVWFASYFAWFKIHKKYENEWIILMWTWILINFAVILTWRYLIWDNWYLSEGTTFLFLILNTIFWVLTSLIYKSKTLLIFSFIFAYLNPFIIWAESNWEPYTLIWYSFIVSLWALFIAQKNQSIILFVMSFIFWNFLIFVAPTSDSIWEISKLIVLNLFNVITIYNSIKFSDKYKLIIELTFAWVFFIIWTVIFNINSDSINLYLLAIVSSFIFLFYAYFLSKRKTYLFSIWTVWVILTLSPIIVNNYQFIEWLQNSAPSNILQFNLSILAIIIFAIANLILPFINSKLLKKKNINNLIIGSLAWAGFLAFEIYSFWEEHFSWIAEWLTFLALAIIYFMQWYFVAKKLGFENMKKDKDLQNTFYSFIWISISLFSIAVAFIFADTPEIITTVWLFEATILNFFYSKNSSLKIFWAAIILFIIWLTKFWILIDEVSSKQYLFLISFSIILSSFILNLYFINKVKENKEIHNIHYFLHLIWMWIMWALLLKIIPSTGHGWSLFWISIFITILWYFYARFKANFLKIVFLFLIWLFGLFHIWELNFVFHRLENDNLEFLKIIQYIVSVLIIFNYFIWNKFNLEKKYNQILLIIIWLYSFIISNLFILDLFYNIFKDSTLTIYWGLIASGLLFYWIQKDLIKYRTIWLYFLALTSIKIFLYDVWQIEDTNSRIAVFAILGVVFIIISTFYTKRFWDHLIWEFNLSNLKTSPHSISPKGIEVGQIEENLFIQKLKKIDIEDIKVVRFFPKSWEKFTIRAKNLIRVSRLIIEKTWKTTFKSGELQNMYDFVIKSYKSDLSRREYDKIRSAIKDFIISGWEVELVKK